MDEEQNNKPIKHNSKPKHRDSYVRRVKTGHPGEDLSIKQRIFADTYFANGFDKIGAYIEAYGNPRGLRSPLAQRAHAIYASKRVGKYLKWLGKNAQIKYGVDRHYLIKGLLDIIVNYQDMHQLASQDKLSVDEQAKFQRLSSLTKTADLNRTQDMLAKLLGAYEPEQINHTINYKASFGEPTISEIDAEDIDHTDLTEEDNE